MVGDLVGDHPSDHHTVDSKGPTLRGNLQKGAKGSALSAQSCRPLIVKMHKDRVYERLGLEEYLNDGGAIHVLGYITA